MSAVQDAMMHAEAIREVRAAGCTMPGVAEAIVEFHGATHVLANTSRILELGTECAASDSEQGAKMRALLQGEAKEVEATSSVNELENSKPAESQAVPDTGKGVETGSVSDAAVESSAPPAAAGTSAAPAESAAPNTGSQGEGQAQES